MSEQSMLPECLAVISRHCYQCVIEQIEVSQCRHDVPNACVGVCDSRVIHGTVETEVVIIPRHSSGDDLIHVLSHSGNRALVG